MGCFNYKKALHLKNHLIETFSLLENNWPPYLQVALEAHTQIKFSYVLVTPSTYWSDNLTMGSWEIARKISLI